MGYFIALFLLLIIASLAAAGFFMLRKAPADAPDPAATKPGEVTTSVVHKRRMAQALTLRIGLSVALFVCVLIAWQLGFIQPTGLPLK